MVLALTGGVVIGIGNSCQRLNQRVACPPLQTFVSGPAFIGDLLALAVPGWQPVI